MNDLFLGLSRFYLGLFNFIILRKNVISFIFFIKFLEPNAPTDGQWSDWGDWTQCDKTCGTGKQVRERTCTNPPPENGGKGCEGSAEDVQDCKLAECRKF